MVGGRSDQCLSDAGRGYAGVQEPPALLHLRRRPATLSGGLAPEPLAPPLVGRWRLECLRVNALYQSRLPQLRIQEFSPVNIPNRIV